METDRRAMARVGGPRTFGLARTVISLYHGFNRGGDQRAFQTRCPRLAGSNFRVYALQHLAISPAGAATRRRSARFEGCAISEGVAACADARPRNLHVRGTYIALGDYARGEELP